MLLLFDSTTSCAKVLAWLPDAPPNLVPLGNVIVCGFCSPGCCTTSCCGGGCAHAQNTAVIITIVITDKSFFLIKFPPFYAPTAGNLRRGSRRTHLHRTVLHGGALPGDLLRLRSTSNKNRSDAATEDP